MTQALYPQEVQGDKMVRCSHCSLLETIIHSEECINRCALHELWNLDPEEERKCLDFQPGP